MAVPLARKGNTRVEVVEGEVSVYLHGTRILSFDESQIVLNSGGYQTVTTKQRLNQASHECGLGYHVYQKDRLWFVEYRGQVTDFSDHMTLWREAFVPDEFPHSTPEDLLVLGDWHEERGDEQMAKLAKLWSTRLKEGE